MLIVKKCKYGRGVFTTAKIEAGDVLLVDDLLLITPEDRLGSLTLRRYDFAFHDTKEAESGIALGLASLLNHSSRPNAEFDTAYNSKGLPVVFVTAIKDIKAGSQITIDYGYDPLEVT
jgi:hypothetical protein